MDKRYSFRIRRLGRELICQYCQNVIYKDLIALGGTENKNLTLKFPDIPEEYLNDFIRGYFDGDGSVMDLKNNRLNTAFTCGSKEFLDALHTILKESAELKAEVMIRVA